MYPGPGAPVGANDISQLMRENAKQRLRDELGRNYPRDASVQSVFESIEKSVYDKSSNAAEYQMRLNAKLQQALTMKKARTEGQRMLQQQQQQVMGQPGMMPQVAGNGYDMNMQGYGNPQAPQQPVNAGPAAQYNPVQYAQQYQMPPAQAQFNPQQPPMQQQQQQQTQQPVEAEGGLGDLGDDFADFCSQVVLQPASAAAQPAPHQPVRAPMQQQQQQFVPQQPQPQPNYMANQAVPQGHPQQGAAGRTVNPFQMPGAAPQVPNAATNINPFVAQASAPPAGQVQPGAANRWAGAPPQVPGPMAQQQTAAQMQAKAPQQMRPLGVPPPGVVQQGPPQSQGQPAQALQQPVPGAVGQPQQQQQQQQQPASAPAAKDYSPEQLKEMYWQLQGQLRTKYLDRLRVFIQRQKAILAANASADPTSAPRMQQRMQQLLGLVKTLEMQRTDPGAESVDTGVQAILVLQKYQRGVAKLLEEGARMLNPAKSPAPGQPVRQPSPALPAPVAPEPVQVTGDSAVKVEPKTEPSAAPEVKHEERGESAGPDTKVKAEVSTSAPATGAPGGAPSAAMPPGALSRVLSLLGAGPAGAAPPGSSAPVAAPAGAGVAHGASLSRIQGGLQHWLQVQTAIPAVPVELLRLLPGSEDGPADACTQARCVTVCGEHGPTQLGFAANSPDSSDSETVALPEHQALLEAWLAGEPEPEASAVGAAGSATDVGSSRKRRRQELADLVAQADVQLAVTGVHLKPRDPHDAFERGLCRDGGLLVQCSVVVAGGQAAAAIDKPAVADEAWQQLTLQVPANYPESPAVALFSSSSPAYPSPQGTSARHTFQMEVENSESASTVEELACLWRDTVKGLASQIAASAAQGAPASGVAKPPLVPPRT